MSRIILIGLLFLLFIGCKKEEPNTPPVANFTYSPVSGKVDTLFTFDASISNDKEDELEVLEFRWDFESDSIWDTEYSNSLIETHKYEDEGSYIISLEVKDSEGLTDLKSKELLLSKDSVILIPEIIPISPAYEEMLTDSSITLVWSANTEMEYLVKFGTASPLEVINETTDTFLLVPDLERNIEYFWMVEGVDKFGNSASTDTLKFHISNDQDEEVLFLNPSPSNNKSAYTVPQVFSCEVKYDGGHIEKYVFEAGPAPFEWNRTENKNEPRFIIYEDLEFDDELYWRMSAEINGKLISSPVWKFIRSEFGFPYLPFDPRPANEAIVESNTINLSWDSGLDDPMEFWKVVYRIYIGDSPDDLKLVSEQKDRDYLLKDVLSGRDVYWRVDAEYESFLTEGDVWMFSTKANVTPLIAYNTNPKAGSVLYTLPDKWTWEVENPNGGDLIYDVYFGKYPDISQIYNDISQKQIPSPTGLEPDEHYLWRIDVINENGDKTKGKTKFLHMAPSHQLKKINHYRSDTIYDIRVFEYDNLGRMTSNIQDSYSYFYYEYPWIRMDSVVYEYDEFNRVSRIASREKFTGSNGWFLYDNSYVVNHLWDSDTLCFRKNNEGKVQDIFVYDGSGRNILMYHDSFLTWQNEDATPHLRAEYDDGYLPRKITYLHSPNYSGSFGDIWEQDMQYDGHPNPYFQIPFLRKYQLDSRTKFAPTEFAENTVTIDRSRRYGTDHIVFKYEYNAYGYVTKKWAEGNKGIEYWEFFYE